MLDQRVSLITLGVSDLPRARAFYAALGWREAGESMEDIAFFQLLGQALALYPLSALAADQGRPLGSGSGAVTLAQNLGSRAAVDALAAEAEAAGATILRRPEPTPWGGYVAYLADPDGHVWEFSHVPQFPLGPDGALTLPSAAPPGGGP
jgi:catechol 2,3-dioxygenase-like lactoylglutathione lyase family enzyme